ncbi:hypothetical protein BBSC_0398 [Bifidobacterium scardovii JCM 12489 = DSM 13734]|nr:hypothetical protein BBSC_0398 [Bifidobacterium scardovii JCM 12489 = DSM 13734]
MAVFLGGTGIAELMLAAHDASAAKLLIGAVCLIVAMLVAAIAFRNDDNQHKEE